ncbi:hypothetical protein [Clostridioides difficile]|uniref:hypothetical protein n=1 Tax=Clostridioides difficile TaxID=1496 RepID=UPI0009800CFF|nr:hypothetical protein [Clostridioides difficile]SJP57398.1 Uncharacterised protein [Clostridioides difficile]
MIKFEIGKTYATRSVCDHDCMFTIEVIKRTDKTITYKEDDTVRRAKIRFSDDYEYIRNFDQYVDEFSTLEEAEECLQECLSA